MQKNETPKNGGTKETSVQQSGTICIWITIHPHGSLTPCNPKNPRGRATIKSKAGLSPAGCSSQFEEPAQETDRETPYILP